MDAVFKGFFTAVGTALVSLALIASPALANTHVFTTTFGAATSTPANPYPLSGPTDVKVDLSTHDIYVTDPANHRVEKFDPSGTLLLMFGRNVNKTQIVAKGSRAQQDVCDPAVDVCQAGAASSSSVPGSLNTPSFLAVDNSAGPSAGDVYVADALGNRISKFDSAGHLVAGWGASGQLSSSRGINGIAVTTTGDLLVMDGQYRYKIYRYSEAGSPLKEFTVPTFNNSNPTGLAVDGNGHFYKGGGEGSARVSEFSEEGVIADTVTPGPITGLTTDPQSNELYVDEQGSFIAHFQPNCGEGCIPAETFGSGKLNGARGIGVDSPSDNAYVANTGDNDVAVFEGVGPYVTTGQASAVGRTTATVTGHLSTGGRGAITGCHFEYGTDDSYSGGSLPCEPSPPYGSEADVTANLIGLQPETTYHYRLVVSNAAGTSDGQDQTLTPHFVIGAKTDPAINLTNVSAELTGSYTGDGNDTKYYFQYGPTQEYGEATAELDNGVGAGPQSLTPVPLTNLQPATTYHYRLVAINSFGTTYASDQVFATYDRPLIAQISTSNLTATTAELHAKIDPRGSDTTYRFEYGTTTSYGTSIPSPDQDIGSAPGSQELSVTLTNLQVGLTYHFRAVAENAYGQTVTEDQDFGFYPPECPNATVRQETSSNHLPDCRAFELVSPSNAGGTSIYPAGPNSPLATSPSRFAFGGFLDAIPDSGDPVNVFGDLYVATRTATGWGTRYVGIPGTQTNEASGPPGEISNGLFLTAPAGVRTDLQMNRFIDWNVINYGFANYNPSPEFGPYVWSASGESVGRWPTAEGYPPGPILNQSPDLGHYYYISGGTYQLGGEYQEVFVYEGGSAYDNDVNAGTIEPIALDSQGAPINIRGVPGSSVDGSHILMSTTECTNRSTSSCAPGELYMRVDDSVTFDIVKGHTTLYMGMTGDGRTVYFTSAEQLTAADLDTSTDLYMWNQGTNSVTLVSRTPSGGNTDACSASWTEQCGIVPLVNSSYNQVYTKGGAFGNGLSDSAVASGTGDIYFYSPEQLDGAKGAANRENLYLYRNGTVHFVFSFVPGTYCEGDFQPACSNGPIARLQISPDGSHMAFLTASRVTSYDNAKHAEMYTYDPASEQIVCVSCRPNGALPFSEVWASSNGIFMTDDGRTFFSTVDPLVPQDTDGLRDIYEYVEGRAQLISSGTSGKDASPKTLFGINGALFTSGLVGVSADGTNAYFSTYDTLVPQDRNGGFLKFYDARTGGGFPFIAPPAPCEAADECVGSGSSPRAVPPKTTSVGLGHGGNATPRKRHRHHKATKKHRKAHRKHSHDQRGHHHG